MSPSVNPTLLSLTILKSKPKVRAKTCQNYSVKFTEYLLLV